MKQLHSTKASLALHHRRSVGQHNRTESPRTRQAYAFRQVMARARISNVAERPASGAVVPAITTTGQLTTLLMAMSILNTSSVGSGRHRIEPAPEAEMSPEDLPRVESDSFSSASRSVTASAQGEPVPLVFAPAVPPPHTSADVSVRPRAGAHHLDGFLSSASSPANRAQKKKDFSFDVPFEKEKKHRTKRAVNLRTNRRSGHQGSHSSAHSNAQSGAHSGDHSNDQSNAYSGAQSNAQSGAHSGAQSEGQPNPNPPSNEPLLDTDHDGIPDLWEEKGYTVDKHKIIAWDKGVNGKPKYTSDPYNARSAGDPYTDREKVLDQLPSGIPDTAKHPLVACSPSLVVVPDYVALQNWDVITTSDTKETGGSKTEQTGSTHSVSMKQEVKLSLTDTSFTSSLEYGVAYSSSTEIETHSSDSHTHQELLDSTQAAILKASVRVKNTGTAPAYNVKTTTNVFVKPSDNTQERMISTLATGGSSQANVLMPGKTYPAKGEHGIILDRKSDEVFKSELIVSKDEVAALEKPGSRIVFETPQTSSLYAKIDSNNGDLVINNNQQWAPYDAEVNEKCASIKLFNGPSSTEEFKVSTGNTDFPVTIADALQALIKPEYSTSDAKFYHTHNGVRFEYCPEHFEITLSKESKMDFEKFVRRNKGKSVLDMPMVPQMSMRVRVPVFFSSMENLDSFEKTEKFELSTAASSAHFIALERDENIFLKLPQETLKPNAKYKVSMLLKSTKQCYLNVAFNGKTIPNSNYRSVEENWKKVEFILETPLRGPDNLIQFIRPTFLDNVIVYVKDLLIFPYDDEGKPR